MPKLYRIEIHEKRGETIGKTLDVRFADHESEAEAIACNAMAEGKYPTVSQYSRMNEDYVIAVSLTERLENRKLM